MNLGVFEDERCVQLLPLVWLRAVFELQCGRDRLIDKVFRHVSKPLHRVWVRDSLRGVIDDRIELDVPDPKGAWLLLNARALVTRDISPPSPGTAWERNGALAGVMLTAVQVAQLPEGALESPSRLHQAIAGLHRTAPPDGLELVNYPWDLMLASGRELTRQCTDGGVNEGRVDPGAHLLDPGGIHIARGARVKPGVVLDAENGPIHIDRGAEIQPGAVLIGPCFVGEYSIIRPQAIIRANTAIGPVCKIGGEVEATIFQGLSNKQHDGFLGHSCVGRWVNIGAATVTSDLKNTYGSIRVNINGVGVETGQHHIGTIFGDHAKTGIGTILPTGCVIGVAANVFTQNPVPKFVPSFAWLTDDGLTQYRLEKAIRIAGIVMARRERELTPNEKTLMEYVAETAREVEAAGWQ
jgi:UDP-N-acetylglucosamine diphosphorylase/glucosamine-1-phosphate N-acetyltransferase